MKNIISSNNGVAAVEFALISPLLFALLFGIIEFGMVLYNQAVITNASREAARYAATFYTNPANATATRPTCDEIKNYAVAYVNAQTISFTNSTPFSTDNVICPDGSSPYYNYSSYAGYVDTIRIEYQYGFLVLGNLIQLFPGGTQWSSLTLRAQTSMRDENQSS